jgi:hypothetical protein
VRGSIDTSQGILIEPVELEGADLTAQLDYDTAKALFVEQDPQAIMQAFFGGKIRITGDATKLLTLPMPKPGDSSPELDLLREISERVKPSRPARQRDRRSARRCHTAPLTHERIDADHELAVGRRGDRSRPPRGSRACVPVLPDDVRDLHRPSACGTIICTCVPFATSVVPGTMSAAASPV